MAKQAGSSIVGGRYPATDDSGPDVKVPGTVKPMVDELEQPSHRLRIQQGRRHRRERDTSRRMAVEADDAGRSRQ